LGLLLSLLASFIFLAVRGRASSYGAFLLTLARGGLPAMFETFMEGFGIGFLLYRVGAWLGAFWTSIIVAVLFMAGHIPNYTHGLYHLSLPVALIMLAAHAGIGVVIFLGVWDSQDIVVLGFLHWFINAASSFTTH
jgi:hypothetical protein